MTSTAPWVIRRQPLAEDADYPYPWEYSYRGGEPEEDSCGAGGHYGSTATFADAVESIGLEWEDHLRMLEAARTCPQCGGTDRELVYVERNLELCQDCIDYNVSRCS